MNFIKANITIDEKTGCWNWNKSVTSAGYGQFTRNKKYWTTHRFVYTQVYGEIPPKMVVRHQCHNTKCCNPEHLLLGTDKDNYHDSIETHKNSRIKLAKAYIINGIKYKTLREALKSTKISSHSLVKFTDPNTRVFNIEVYRKNALLHVGNLKYRQRFLSFSFLSSIAKTQSIKKLYVGII